MQRNRTDSLARQLDAFATALRARTDDRNRAALDRLGAGACAVFAELTPLRTGDTAGAFCLPDQNGRNVALGERLATGPVVLYFIRGGWCPFCTITLRALQRAHAPLRDAGGSLIVVSGQTVAENLATAEANFVRFPILADPAHDVARRYGLMWALDAEIRGLYQRLGHDVPQLNGTGVWELPITASYVVAQDHRIARAHVEPCATRRMEPRDAIAAVRALREAPADVRNAAAATAMA